MNARSPLQKNKLLWRKSIPRNLRQQNLLTVSATAGENCEETPTSIESEPSSHKRPGQENVEENILKLEAQVGSLISLQSSGLSTVTKSQIDGKKKVLKEAKSKLDRMGEEERNGNEKGERNCGIT